MMTREENDLLTRVSNGAPMGAMLRQYWWIPAALSEKLVADGTPLRVKLFGARYVAFRATDGRVGFFDEACPHRGVSLALARNEDNALRCIYHGWKFGVDGSCLEVPTQVGDQADICRKVKLGHYKVREAAGIVWVWLGSGDTPPPFPAVEFTGCGAGQVVPTKQTGNFNWLQGVETTMDSAHLGVLHQTSLKGLGAIANAAVNQAPVYELEEEAYGFRYAAIRNLENGQRYARVNCFVLPWYGVISPPHIEDAGGTVFFTVPIDDENSTYWSVPYRTSGSLPQDSFTVFSDAASWPPPVPGGPEDNWGQDRELMKRGHFTGFPQHLTTEDLAVITSQGPIVDRTKEFLNNGDGAVVRLRRLLLQSVREFMAGEVPRLARHDSIAYPTIRPFAAMLGDKEDWRPVGSRG
jgi:phthalate 4,5-dioxygenase oxygenase subunit